MFSGLQFAQEVKSATPKVKPVEKSLGVAKVDLLEIESISAKVLALDASKKSLEYQSQVLQYQFRDLNTQITELQKSLNAKLDEEFKKAGLSRETHDLDNKGNFVKKVQK